MVPVDERTRASGEGGTTSNRRSARSVLKTWCSSTKEQGLAGREAPRPTGGRPARPQRRGACRRKNKGLRGGRHHAQPAVGPPGPKDVVPVDERTRASGEGGTTSNRRSARPAPKTWCLSTKEQGLAGREAPRPTGGGAPHFRRRLHPSGRAPHGGRRPHTSATAPPTAAEPNPTPKATKKGPTHSRSSKFS